MPASKPLDITLALHRTAADPPMTHDRLGRPIAGPCLIWTRKIPKSGYPILRHLTFGEAPQLVHRVAYAIATGHPLADIRAIPTLDHLCRTPACSAAAHLEPVTRRENVHRGNGNQNEIKTHCIRGHEFSVENTYADPRGGRQCRECKKVRAREWYRKQKRPDLAGKPPLWENGRPRSVVRVAKPRRGWTDGT